VCMCVFVFVLVCVIACVGESLCARVGGEI